MALLGGFPSSQAERPRNPFSSSPPVGDFYAPFFTVEFTNYKEDKGSVKASAGETLYKFEDAPQLRSFATSLEIANNNGVCTATLVLEPPYYEAIHIVEAQVVQRDSIMSCQWGYLPGGPGAKAIVSRMHHFTLTKTPAMSVSGTDVTVTIMGIDAFSNAAMRREDRTAYARNKSAYNKLLKAAKAKTEHSGTRKSGGGADAEDHHMQKGLFENDLKILEHLVAKVGMTINTSLVPKGARLLQNRPLDGETEDILEQNELDWTFFLKLCAENTCGFFTEGGVVYVVDEDFVTVQQTSYRLLLMRQPETDRDIPMLEFSVNDVLEELFSSPEGAEIRGVSGDLDTGTVTDLTLDPAKMSAKEFLGKKTNAGREGLASGRSIKLSDGITLIPNPAFTASETGRHMPVPHDKTNREESVAQEARRGALVANTKATATIPGVPSLIPHMLVEVAAGFPLTFDGPYKVMQATHRIGGDGYSTQLELLRDTTSSSAEGEGETPATGGNTPDAQSSGTEGVPSVGPDGKPT